MSDTTSEMHYEIGNRAAWALMLGECMRRLGYDSAEAQGAAWIAEREATVATLRYVCEAHGDNEWPDDLHLADVVEKHLARYLFD